MTGSGNRSAAAASFKAALPLTLPIGAGFLFLGAAYGLLMHAKGFGVWYPLCMSALIYAGSMEFVTVDLLLGAFNPLSGLVLALLVNARHLFYGLSMLGRFRGLGWKKPYLIFGMCDETFSINATAAIPAGADRGWFMLVVTALNHMYWVGGATLGWFAGGLLPFDTRGIEFVLTALFLVIFLDQWMSRRRHLPALTGVLCTLACLVAFGSEHFMLPSLAAILLLLVLLRPYLDGPSREAPEEDTPTRQGSAPDGQEPNRSLGDPGELMTGGRA